MEYRERGIRIPLMLIGCVFGYVQAGVWGSLVGIGGGFAVGTWTTSMLAGTGIMTTAFLVVWLQTFVSTPDGSPAPGADSEAVAADAERGGWGTLSPGLAPGRSATLVCVRNRLDRPVAFQYRWDPAGPWVSARLPAGGSGFAVELAGGSDTELARGSAVDLAGGSDTELARGSAVDLAGGSTAVPASTAAGPEERLEFQWPVRRGSSSMRTRWLAPVQAVGPVDSGQCAEFRPIEFRLRGSEVETFRADLGAQAVTCLINRTGASIPYARSWNGVDWHNDVVEDRHRRWSSSEAGRVLRVRLPDRIGAPVSEGSVHELESRMSAEAADCDDGVMYVLRRDGDRIDVTRLP